MPKPLYGENGSGMHINQSLSRGGQNAFFDPSDELQLSATAYGYIAGLLEHLPAPDRDLQPDGQLVQAADPGLRGAGLHRLVAGQPLGGDPHPGQARPLDARRAAHARSHGEPVPRVRVPPAGRASTASSAACARRRRWTSTSTTSPTRSRPSLGIKGLPHNLEDALTALEADTVLQTALGDHIYDAFISEKRKEWADYREQVHDWEFKQYLDRY